MANGNHALRLVPEMAPPEVADSLAEKVASLSFDPEFGGIDGWITALIIELDDLIMNAAQEIRNGGLGPEIRSQGGDLVSALVALRSKIGKRAFAAAVRRVDRTRRGTPLDAEMADDIIEVVTEVATQAAMMN